MAGDDEEGPPLVKRWGALYGWVLVSLGLSIALLYGLSRFGT